MFITGLAALLLAFTQASFATSFIQLPFPETVEKTQNIVRGIIGTKDVRTVQMRDGADRVFTYFQLNISEVLKGKVTRNPILIRSLGGEKDGVGLSIAGAVDFNPGEDVVVMLMEENSDSSFDVRSLMMGKMTLRKDMDGNEYLVGPVLDGHNEHRVQGGQPDPNAGKKWSLADLRELVKSQGAEAIGPDLQKKQEVVPVKTLPPSSAPKLQSTTTGGAEHDEEEKNIEQESSANNSVYYYGAAALILLLGVWIFRKRS